MENDTGYKQLYNKYTDSISNRMSFELRKMMFDPRVYKIKIPKREEKKMNIFKGNQKSYEFGEYASER